MTTPDDQQPSARDLRQKPVRMLAGRKGVALIMVLFVVTVLTVVSVEFQYESRVYLQTTANFRDRLRAQYLARSAVQFTRILLYLQTTVDQMLKQYLKSNAPSIQLWQLIPVDSDLVRAIAGGFFSMQEQKGLIPGAAGEAVNNEGSVAAQTAKDMNQLSFGKGEGFGDFEGHFHSDVIDEESKININIRPGVAREVTILRSALERLFSPTKYNPLFENPDSRGVYHDRQELIFSIIDWIDPDTQRQGYDGGDESTRYDNLPEKYPSKNHLFDSLDELQLVAGVDDRFWRLFSESLTVYRTSKININTCGPEVMRALLEGYLPQPLPSEGEMQRTIDTIMNYRAQNAGFWNESAFVNFLTNGPELTLEFADKNNGKAALQQAVTVSSGVFTVKASGDVNGVLQSIKVVMTKSGALLYYRVE